MSQFDESKHNRHSDGKFASKPHAEASGVSLQPGDRVRLVKMDDPYTTLRPGDEGTVQHIDSIGTAHTRWDNGSGLGLVPGEDEWEVIDTPTGPQPERFVGSDGRVEWRLPNRSLHRVGGPAVIKPNGTQEWWQHNQLHREDGPAIIGADGTEIWYKNGKEHRIGGPSYVDPKRGYESWSRDGVRHRVDGGPALVVNGSQQWYENGELHRVGGPAVVSKDGRQEWWVRGKKHKVDGPAVTHPNGSQEWWVDGERQEPPQGWEPPKDD